MADQDLGASISRMAKDVLNSGGLSEKEKVLVRIHARRAMQGLEADQASASPGSRADSSASAPASPASSAASEASAATSSRSPLAPVAAPTLAGSTVLVEPVPAQSAAERTFPRSMTLRLALQNPASFALGLGLIWKLGSARVLLLRALVALLKK